MSGTTHARVWWRSTTALRVERVTATGEGDTYAWHGKLHTWDFEGNRLRTILTAFYGEAQQAARMPWTPVINRLRSTLNRAPAERLPEKTPAIGKKTESR